MFDEVIIAAIAVDWKSAFLPTVSIWEIMLRGSIMYLGILALLRFVLKRESGSVSTADLLVMVLIADAAQNAMASDYKSIPEGLVLVSTIVFWSFTMDWLGYHVPAVERFLHPPPLPLIQKGRLVRRNMKSEMITRGELMSQMREQGIEKVEDVKIAYLEGDGTTVLFPTRRKATGVRRIPATRERIRAARPAGGFAR